MVFLLLFLASLSHRCCAFASNRENTSPALDPLNITCHGPPSIYTVEPSPGKGLGVFALHDLDIGDIAMRETPVITIRPVGFKEGTGYPMHEIAKLVQEQYNTLSTEEQEEVMSLTSHATAHERKVLNELAIIFRTNAYYMEDKIGLFPKIARINHSCRPNTSYYWSEKLNKRIVYATRKIKKGEEFFVSYIPLLLPTKHRQDHLGRYGFKCSCEACSQDDETRKTSDHRRLTLSKAFDDFEPQLTLTPPKSKSAMQQARNNAKASVQLAELVEEEGLADYYAKAYRVAAISHARIEAWEPAAIWSNKAYELRMMEDPDSSAAQELRVLTHRFIMNWQEQMREQASFHDEK